MAIKNSVSIVVSLDGDLLRAIDKLRVEWGIHRRADIVVLLLAELLMPESTEALPPGSVDSKDS
jgi:metal-responsive CopG/Arc/MetJ family transcriptional regulator